MSIVRSVRLSFYCVIGLTAIANMLTFSFAPALAEDPADTTAPVFVTGSQLPADNSTTGNVLIPIAGTYNETGSGLNTTSIDLVINGLPCPAGSIIFNGNTFTYTPVFAYDDSLIEVAVSVTDLAGNISATTVWSFSISSPPVILSALASGGTVVPNYVNAANSTVLVTGSVPTDLAGEQSVEIFLNGASFSEPLTTFVVSTLTGFTAVIDGNRFSALISSDGVKNLSARRTGYSGNLSNFSPETVLTVDTLAPTGSIQINAGDIATTTANVSLVLSTVDSSPVVKMAFSNDNITYADWQDFNTSLPYILPSGDGVKTVYVKFQDVAGNISTPVSASITLNSAPTTSDDAPSTWSKTDVTVTLTATQTNPPVATYYSTDGSAPTVLYTAPFILSLEGSYQLKYYSIDTLGNTEPVKTGTLVKIDKTTPTAVTGIKEDNNSDGNDEDYTNTKNIRLAWSAASDTSSGIDYYQLRVRKGTAGSNYITGLVDINMGNDTSYTLTADQAGLLTEGVYSFGIRAVDLAGNYRSVSAYSDGTTIDLTAPAIALNGDSVINLNKGDSFTDPGASWIDTIDGSGNVFSTESVNTNVAGIYVLHYSYTDKAGNASVILSRTVYVAASTLPAAPTVDPITRAVRGSVTLSGTASTSGVINLTLTSGVTLTASTSVEQDNTWSKTIDISGLADGAVAVSATLTDSNDNISPAADTSFLKDTLAPTIDSGLKTDNPGYPKRPTVQATLTDAISGVDPALAVMRINGVAVNAVFNAGNGKLSFIPGRDLASRDYYVTIDARDNAGNAAIRYSFTFTVTP